MRLIGKTGFRCSIERPSPEQQSPPDPNPCQSRFLGRTELDSFAVQDNLPRVRAGTLLPNLHERALSGAIFAHDGMHFARPNAKINGLDNTYAR
jgi:hypothetical protein